MACNTTKQSLLKKQSGYYRGTRNAGTPTAIKGVGGYLGRGTSHPCLTVRCAATRTKPLATPTYREGNPAMKGPAVSRRFSGLSQVLLTEIFATSRRRRGSGSPPSIRKQLEGHPGAPPTHLVQIQGMDWSGPSTPPTTVAPPSSTAHGCQRSAAPMSPIQPPAPVGWPGMGHRAGQPPESAGSQWVVGTAAGVRGGTRCRRELAGSPRLARMPRHGHMRPWDPSASPYLFAGSQAEKYFASQPPPPPSLPSNASHPSNRSLYPLVFPPS